MTTQKVLLRIDASARLAGSHTRALGDRFEELWTRANPEGTVVRRDVGCQPVPHLTQAEIDGRRGRGLSDELIEELFAADDVLVTSPLYNFGVPSTLKAYVDHVVRAGRTFAVEGSGYRGLLAGRAAFVLTARGGRRPTAGGVAAELDQGPFLQGVFEFLGFERIENVALEGTSEDELSVKASMAEALARIEQIFERPGKASTLWVGAFPDEDRAAIEGLRSRQAAAILAGDAEAYAELCADDVLLLLQGQPLAVGRAQFLERESTLLRGTRFRALRQLPLRVDRCADLAVEVGHQEVELEPSSASQEAYRRRRKYVHVLRHTTQGWRFAVLTSNNDA